MDWKLALQIAGVILGLLYLYLEYKADIRLWIVGLLMPLVHGTLYFRSGLYADFGMQMYYVAAGIYGMAAWIVADRRGKTAADAQDSPAAEDTGTEKDTDAAGIRFTPRKVWLPVAAAYAVLHLALYLFLSCCTDSTVPFWDAFTTAVSVVAMWMLSRKYVEQWLLWCVTDAATVALYLYKGIPLTACLYLLYTVLAVAGWRKWRRAASANGSRL